jgi:acyl-CoA dehydrogenase
MIAFELPKKALDQRAFINEVVKKVIRPVSRKYDEAEHQYPEELEMLRGGSAVLTGREKKEEDKGKKKEPSPDRLGSNMMSVMSIEEICWGDAGMALSIPGAGLGNAAINAVATDEQLEKFGDVWAAMAITEPGSGSDSGSIQTTARLDGDEWVLNGEKIFVTSADRCNTVVVWATVDPEAGKAGIKSFVVKKGTPGFKLEKLEYKLGIRASDTGTFILKDCRIPKENILGSAEVKTKSTEGFKGVMKTFDNTRPAIAAMALGITRAALDFLREQMEENGMTIDYHQNPNNVGSMEKDYYMMEANLEAARLLTWRAAWMADNKEFNAVEASMCKAKAGRSGTLSVQKVCDLLGPMGFTKKHLAEKWMRDIKIMDIFEGTGQIQHLIVARNILRLSSKELK